MNSDRVKLLQARAWCLSMHASVQEFYEEKLNEEDYVTNRFYALAKAGGVPKTKVKSRLDGKKAHVKPSRWS